MKKQISRIIVLLFVLTMCLLMSISAHAETGNRYFFGPTMPSVINLDGVTITPTNVNGSVASRPQNVFNENVNYYVKVCSGSKADKKNDTQLKIETNREGILIVYYARPWAYASTVNDVKDLNIII